MAKRYFSVDIEASGRAPGKYSMLSLGACLVDDIKINFYRELKPINMNYSLEAMRVASRGLKCLKDFNLVREYNPDDREFKPFYVLNLLKDKGALPRHVMQDFRKWTLEAAGMDKPVIAAAPIRFDGGFVTWYFDNFCDPDPFGHSGEDINSMYRGFRRDLNASIKDLGLRAGELSHNALEDAIQQAKEAAEVFRLMKQKENVAEVDIPF